MHDASVGQISAESNTALSGFIYAIGIEGSAHVKIGCTRREVVKRLVQLQRERPERLNVLASVAVATHLFDIEGYIHRILAEYHLFGEWFAYPITAESLATFVLQAQDSLARLQSHALANLDDILEDGTLSSSKKLLLCVTDCPVNEAALTLQRPPP